MSGYLLDTNVTLIALANPSRLAPAARRVILMGPNVLSVITYWEVVLKSMKGNLDVGDPQSWWRDALDQLAASPLALRAEHVAGVCDLPPIHRDPFDRVLIAQAIAEELRFVSVDETVRSYASAGLRVIPVK
ncbi:MAG: type II toxin-antitoxin system VapC family toxin [Acidobacteriaceae bacterium]